MWYMIKFVMFAGFDYIYMSIARLKYLRTGVPIESVVHRTIFYFIHATQKFSATMWINFKIFNCNLFV